MDVEKLEENIGRKCKKRPLDDKNKSKHKAKPFKSGNKINTILGVIPHPHLEGEMAYTFEEDESYVECRRCEIIKPKVGIKTKEEIFQSEPIKPRGYWWRACVSNLIFFSFISTPLFSAAFVLLLFGFMQISAFLAGLTLVSVLLMSFIFINNIGPVFSDRHLNIHYYKKKRFVWDKWWLATSRHIQYLDYKKKHES